MSVVFARGFRASGVAAGLKSNGNLDLALVVNDGPSDAVAAVFTSNRCQANPVIWSKQVIQDGRANAIVLNSGGANCYTGSEGFQTTHLTAERVADLLKISAGDVVVCSTGIIGVQLDRHKLLSGLEVAVTELGIADGISAAQAIMTTDSIPKLAQFEHAQGWRIGAMAKGAGMLAPALATMLVVITTDAALRAEQLQAALQQAVEKTFNRLDSDGCTSTNDQVTLLASGASLITPEMSEFQNALTSVCDDLANQLMKDAEGSTHDILISVSGAKTEDDAVEVGRSVARNNLFKAAIFGNDPNWGRILAAVGTTKAEFDPYNIDVSINGVRISSKGQPDKPRDLVNLSAREVLIEINLNAGDAAAMIRTNDLSHAYVEENSAYSS